MQKISLGYKVTDCYVSGDGPESVADGLDAALNMPYRSHATKVVIFIADAPPHGLKHLHNGDGFPDVRLPFLIPRIVLICKQGCPCGIDPIEVARKMVKKGIVIYSVMAGNYNRGTIDFMAAVAAITEGNFIATSVIQLTRFYRPLYPIEGCQIAVECSIGKRPRGIELG